MLLCYILQHQHLSKVMGITGMVWRKSAGTDSHRSVGQGSQVAASSLVSAFFSKGL